MAFNPYQFMRDNPEFASLFGGQRTRVPPPKPVRVFNTDEERMVHFVETRVQTVVFWSVHDLSLKDLRRACDAMGIDTSSFLQKEEFKAAIDVRRNDKCPICYDAFAKDENVSVTLCGHWYHQDCLKAHAKACVQRTPGEMAKCALGCGALNKRPERSLEVEDANKAAKRARR